MIGGNPENHDSQGQRRFALYTSWGDPWGPGALRSAEIISGLGSAGAFVWFDPDSDVRPEHVGYQLADGCILGHCHQLQVTLQGGWDSDIEGHCRHSLAAFGGSAARWRVSCHSLSWRVGWRRSWCLGGRRRRRSRRRSWRSWWRLRLVAAPRIGQGPEARSCPVVWVRHDCHLGESCARAHRD